MAAELDLPALAGAARAGDDEAFCSLARHQWARLVGLARGIVGDADAEDAVQEGLVDAWRSRAQLAEPGAFATWLRRIVVRRCVRRARLSRLRQLLPWQARADPPEHDPVASLDAARYLAALPARQRAVMVLTAVEGASDSEIAAELGITPASVRSHRRRARATLERLRGDHDEH
jgi:RNA polymerase sigma-70 factor (ECF subfamily)